MGRRARVRRRVLAIASLLLTTIPTVAVVSAEEERWFGTSSVGDPGAAPLRGDHDGAPPLPRRGREVPRDEYRSPYQWSFRTPLDEILFDRDTERGDPRNESSIPYSEWYSERVLRRHGGWGPPRRRFTCPRRVHEWSAEKKRERVVASAMLHVGRDYQHHYIPDWDPPRDWKWNRTGTEPQHQSRGIDCSTFSSWNYDWALGLNFSSAILAQSRIERARLHVEGEEPREVPVQRIARPERYADLLRQLRAGDLLYIKHNPESDVGHVIMWTGAYATSPDGTPLVIDSTGGGHVDSNGVAIPAGVQLRPFTEDSWYWRSFAHAIRIIDG